MSVFQLHCLVCCDLHVHSGKSVTFNLIHTVCILFYGDGVMRWIFLVLVVNGKEQAHAAKQDRQTIN